MEIFLLLRFGWVNSNTVIGRVSDMGDHHGAQRLHVTHRNVPEPVCLPHAPHFTIFSFIIVIRQSGISTTMMNYMRKEQSKFFWNLRPDIRAWISLTCFPTWLHWARNTQWAEQEYSTKRNCRVNMDSFGLKWDSTEPHRISLGLTWDSKGLTRIPIRLRLTRWDSN